MHTSCKSCTKNEVFIAISKNSCTDLARNKLKDNFLASLVQVLYILQEKLCFSAILARYMQGLIQNIASFARKILVRLAHFLPDGFCWDCRYYFTFHCYPECSFIIILHTAEQYMSYTENLTWSLQTRSSDLLQVVKHVSVLKQVLTDAWS